MATTPIKPTWRLEVRDANLNRVGEISNFVALTLLLKFSDAGQFSLEVPYGGNAPAVEAALAAPGAGLIISRDYGNGTMTPLLSGPIWDNTRRGRDATRVLDGWGDLWWLKARLAYPAGGRPYMAQVLLDKPLRYYRLGEPSGGSFPSPLDSSGNGQDGTRSVGTTQGAAGAIPGDPDTCYTFASANSQYLTVPTSGLPTGNPASGFALEAWVKPASLPAAGFAAFAAFGTAGTTNQAANIGFDTTGKPWMSVWGTNAQSATALSAGTWYHLVGVYDGAGHISLYVNGSLVAGPTAVTPNIVLGTATIAQSGRGAEYFNGSLDEVAYYGKALTAAQVAAHYAAGTATHGAYDTRSGTASTVILGYVGANLTAPTNADRQYSKVTLAGDPLVGTTVHYDARYHNLLALCQWLAASGGDLGLRALQSSGTTITVSVYQPQTQANALFSTELGNLLDYEYKVSGPTGNAAAAGGGGTGAGRALYEAADATTIGQYGRVEVWRDERGASTVAALQTAGGDELARDKLLTDLSATPLDTPACAFQRDYNLGDRATVVIDGAAIQDVIRQVAITLDAAGNETITPAIGNPGSGQVGQHDGQQLTDTTVRRLVKLETTLAALTAAQ